MILAYTITISVILHALILQINLPEPDYGKAVKKKTTTVSIKKGKKGSLDGEKFYKLHIFQQFKDLLKSQEEKKGTQTTSRDCKKFYIGIGIVYNELFNEISEVVPGGPAYLAGIKPGDILVKPHVKIKDVYPEGTVINIPIIRNGITINMKVTVAKICYDD